MNSIDSSAPGRLSWSGHRFWALFIAICVALTAGAQAQGQEPERPTFRSRVAVVPITAVVRDARSRVVRDLRSDDFEVLEEGKPRRILEFSANADGPISIAVLYDTSGSMGLASNLAKGKAVVAQLIDGLDPQRDEMAIFTFHKTLREEVPFTSNTAQLRRALEHVKPWGLTSLYDAVGETARRLPERGPTRRAIVVVSDGVDTSSALASREVAALASAIDVPVYVFAVVPSIDNPTAENTLIGEDKSPLAGALADLAAWTGGHVFVASVPAERSASARQIIDELRHQYLIAFESSGRPGWHPLVVRARGKDLTVRARSGYIAGQSRPIS